MRSVQIGVPEHWLRPSEVHTVNPPDSTPDGDEIELRKAILKEATVKKAKITFSRKMYSNDTVSPVEMSNQDIVEIGIDDLMQLILAHTEAKIEKTKQKMAMCTDDKSFLEIHRFANAIEYDEKFKRPSRAIYHNRQWEAEKQGLDVLALLAKFQKGEGE